jgi:hypothetical protein
VIVFKVFFLLMREVAVFDAAWQNRPGANKLQGATDWPTEPHRHGEQDVDRTSIYASQKVSVLERRRNAAKRFTFWLDQ